MTIRQKIVKAVIARLSEIDALNDVVDFDVVDKTAKPTPFAVVKDTNSRIDNKIGGSSVHELNVEIELVMKNADMGELRDLMFFVCQAISETDTDFAAYKEYVGDDITTERNNDFYASAKMRFMFKYASARWEL